MQKRSKTSHGRAAERNLGNRLARLTPGSGALPGAKGDLVYTPDSGIEFLIESKSTTSESLSIKMEWLDKITNEALDAAKNPALSIQFVNDLGAPRKAWIAIPEYVFKILVNGYRDE